MLGGMISARPSPTWSSIRDYPDGPVWRSVVLRQAIAFMKNKWEAL
jgi:hypothetical protein